MDWPSFFFSCLISFYREYKGMIMHCMDIDGKTRSSTERMNAFKKFPKSVCTATLPFKVVLNVYTAMID